MTSESIVFTIFLIFTGAAVLASVALLARQALLIAYIVLGVLVGPAGFGLVADTALLRDMAHVGIIFLLFLLGLNLHPQKLVQLFRQTLIVTLASSVAFAALGYTVARLFGIGGGDAVVIGIAMAFSSTIIGLKLLPTTVLHHRRTGEVIISVLLLQDLIAIVTLLGLHGSAGGAAQAADVLWLALALPLLAAGAYLVERYVLMGLVRRFDRIQEYLFLLAIGWCLGVAQAAHSMGLSYEIGAFIAGVAVAASPVSRFIAESLKPLRDFFLVMFFFTLGAAFDVRAAATVVLPAVLLAGLALSIKPVVFRFLMVSVSENNRLAWEIGFRLGQMSEFSLLIVFYASEAELIAASTAYVVQLATMLTFIGSTYLVVLRYPTPIAVSERLRRD
ncbi:MAG: cation:proton antiporter [Gammaproteobacteria bacterium]|nr:cation:proton antiporter [Gammaproteobacteria bacterium]NIV75701.1 cation:proton antiporter [Gammaproteobacteria bacterium]